MQALVNMVDGVEQTHLNTIFFSMWYFLNAAFYYQGEAQCFSNWQRQGIF